MCEETLEQKEPRQRLSANVCGVALSDSHVSIGVDAAVLLHILHLCWVNMLNLLNSLRLDTGDRSGGGFTHAGREGGGWGVPAAGQAPAGWSPEAGQARWSEEGLWRWSQRLLQGSAWRLEGNAHKPGAGARVNLLVMDWCRGAGGQ